MPRRPRWIMLLGALGLGAMAVWAVTAPGTSTLDCG
jgi:hypothetical protein